MSHEIDLPVIDILLSTKCEIYSVHSSCRANIKQHSTTATHRWNRDSGSQVTGSAILSGSGRVTGLTRVFDPVLIFNMRPLALSLVSATGLG